MHRDIVVNKCLGRLVQIFPACVLNNLQNIMCLVHAIFHLCHQQLVTAANQTSKSSTAEMRNPILGKKHQGKVAFQQSMPTK